jgi:hypothetical protein
MAAAIAIRLIHLCSKSGICSSAHQRKFKPAPNAGFDAEPPPMVIGAARGPESNVTIGAHEYCPFRPDFTLLGPGTARIDAVVAKAADANGNQVDTELCRDVPRLCVDV